MVKIATQCIAIRIAIFTTLRGEIYNSIQYKLQNSMEVNSVGIIAILSMSYITRHIVKIQTSVAKIPRVLLENQITTLSVVKIATKFSPCTRRQRCRKIFFTLRFIRSSLVREPSRVNDFDIGYTNLSLRGFLRRPALNYSTDERVSTRDLLLLGSCRVFVLTA